MLNNRPHLSMERVVFFILIKRALFGHKRATTSLIGGGIE